ncbi:TIGR01621 family pseudouridine synthase [Alteromonadaceae bacterium BrNp21-10]|nr:TIGR01621 family pseudouridine synthase [Alteromonadaceae bacterium BrNp21-10]
MTNATIKLIFSHADFYIIDKPAGIGVHKDDQHQGILPVLCQQLGEDKLWLVHRLDKITSGLLILARNAAAAAHFGELFSQRQVQKYYLAVCGKKPNKKQGTVIGDMQPARNGQWKLTQDKNNPAISQFFSQGLIDGKRLIVVKPCTGKTHQIRVMLKSVGAPILGDERYGGEQADRTYLHAYGLIFHYQNSLIEVYCPPTNGEYFQPLQDESLWHSFQQPQQLPWPTLPTSLMHKALT